MHIREHTLFSETQPDANALLEFLSEVLFSSEIANLKCICPGVPCPVFGLRVFYCSHLLPTAFYGLLQDSESSSNDSVIKIVWRLFSLFHNLPTCPRYHSLQSGSTSEITRAVFYDLIAHSCTVHGVDKQLMNTLLAIAADRQNPQLDSNGYVDFMKLEMLNPVILPILFQCLASISVVERAKIMRNIFSSLATKPRVCNGVLQFPDFDLFLFQLVSDIRQSSVQPASEAIGASSLGSVLEIEDDNRDGDDSLAMPDSWYEERQKLLLLRQRQEDTRKASNDNLIYCLGCMTTLHFYSFTNWISPRFAHAIFKTMSQIRCFSGGWTHESVGFARKFMTSLTTKLSKNVARIRINAAGFLYQNLAVFLAIIVQQVLYTPIERHATPGNEDLPAFLCRFRALGETVKEADEWDDESSLILPLTWNSSKTWEFSYRGRIHLHYDDLSGLLDADLVKQVQALLSSLDFSDFDPKSIPNDDPDLEIKKQLATVAKFFEKMTEIMDTELDPDRPGQGRASFSPSHRKSSRLPSLLAFNVPSSETEIVRKIANKLGKISERQAAMDWLASQFGSNAQSEHEVLMESELIRHDGAKLQVVLTPTELRYWKSNKGFLSKDQVTRVELSQLVVNEVMVAATAPGSEMKRGRRRSDIEAKFLEERPCAFKMYTPQESFVVSARTDELSEIWVHLLQRAIQNAKTRNGKIGDGLLGLDPDLLRNVTDLSEDMGSYELARERRASDLEHRIKTGVAPIMLPKSEAKKCFNDGCTASFFLSRKYHCKSCGNVFCSACVSNTWLLPNIDRNTKSRVCVACLDVLRRAEHKNKVQMLKFLKTQNTRLDLLKEAKTT